MARIPLSIRSAGFPLATSTDIPVLRDEHKERDGGDYAKR